MLYDDDSTNIISSTNPSNIQTYINKFYLLLEAYFNKNFLKIYAEKSKLLISCKPHYRSDTKDIIIQANNYRIQQSNKVKILGL